MVNAFDSMNIKIGKAMRKMKKSKKITQQEALKLFERNLKEAQCMRADGDLEASLYLPIEHAEILSELLNGDITAEFRNGFTVIDTNTGEYPDVESIALKEDWAKNLIYCDIDGFAMDEEGNLLLIDDCDNIAYCPSDRFIIVWNEI